MSLLSVFDSPVIQQRLPEATLETIQMVGFSAVFTALLGLPLGIVLHVTGRGGLRPNPWLSKALGLIVNIGRSLPFLILLIAIIPFTKLVVGTNIGPKAVIVPLTVGAVPFFARLVETAVREVSPGKVEAARVMGSTRLQIVTKVLIPEALPSLVSALTVTTVALISYSAMAGSVGGGGLGFLAISYGYNRYQTDVMVVTVIVLIAIVQVVQLAGDVIARRLNHR